MNIPSAVLWLNAIVFVGFGIACALLPAEISELTVGAAPATASAMTDFRAVYGGMMIGIGALLIFTAREPAYQRAGLVAVLLIMIGMASTRILGMLSDGSPNGYMQAYLAAEIFMAILVSLVLRSGAGENN